MLVGGDGKGLSFSGMHFPGFQANIGPSNDDVALEVSEGANVPDGLGNFFEEGRFLGGEGPAQDELADLAPCQLIDI